MARNTPASEVESVGDSAIGTDEEDLRMTNKEVIVKMNRCFAAVRNALSDQRTRASELTRLLQVCVAKMDQQSVVLQKLMLDRTADAGHLAGLKLQLENIAADAERTSQQKEDAAAEQDTIPWVVSIRVRFHAHLLYALLFALCCWRMASMFRWSL